MGYDVVVVVVVSHHLSVNEKKNKIYIRRRGTADDDRCAPSGRRARSVCRARRSVVGRWRRWCFSIVNTTEKIPPHTTADRHTPPPPHNNHYIYQSSFDRLFGRGSRRAGGRRRRHRRHDGRLGGRRRPGASERARAATGSELGARGGVRVHDERGVAHTARVWYTRRVAGTPRARH